MKAFDGNFVGSAFPVTRSECKAVPDATVRESIDFTRTKSG